MILKIPVILKIRPEIIEFLEIRPEFLKSNVRFPKCNRPLGQTSIVVGATLNKETFQHLC